MVEIVSGLLLHQALHVWNLSPDQTEIQIGYARLKRENEKKKYP